MKTKNEALSRTVAHVSELLERIDNGDELIEQECSQVLDDLADLRAIMNADTTGEQSDMNIDEMLTVFNVSADDSKMLLQNMLSIVASGRVPKESDMRKLDKSVADLREKYNAICSIAMAEVSADEMPEEGASAAEYIEAIRNSASAVYRRKLGEITEVLTQFTSVQSLVSNYAAALRPFQQEAEELMAALKEEAESVEKLEEKIAGPKLFLESVNCEDLDSDEGMDLLDRVAEYYPRRVQNGLAAGKYFISDGAEDKSEDNIGIMGENSEQDTEDITSGFDEIPGAGDDESADSTQKESKDKEDCRTEDSSEKEFEEGIEEDSDEGVEAVSTDETEELSAFAERILTSGLLIDDSSRIGVLSCNCSDSETKKISASIFQNDVRKGSEKALKRIIYEIWSKNNVSPDLFTLISSMPETLAVSSIDYLQKKGYLRRYKLIPWGEFYCASPRLMKALTYKDAAKMIGVRQTQVEDWGTSVADKNTSAACRVVYAKLYKASAATFMDAGQTAFKEKASMFTDSFLLTVLPSDEEISCHVNIGVFWDNVDEADEFLDKMKDYLRELSHIGRVVFAAMNMEKAKILADILLDEIGDVLNEGTIYLYSLTEETYYTYPECNVTDPGEHSDYVADDVDEEEEGAKEIETSDNASGESGTMQLFEEGPKACVAEESSPADAVPKKEEHKTKPVVAKTVSADEDELTASIISLINEDKFYAATAFAKAFSLQYPEYTMFYNQLAHALNDPMGHCNYSTNNVFTLIEKKGDFEDALVISTAIRTFFSNQVRYDYDIKSYYSGIKEYKLLSDYPALSKVVYSLMEFKDNQQKGMDAYADYQSRSKSELEREMSNLQREARIFYENFVIGRKKEKASQKRFIETKKLIFSANSEFGEYIKAIVDGDIDLQPLALEFLQTNFYKEDSTIEEDTIDSDKLWSYILVYWDKAGDLMMYRRHADLMSHLRNNIISTTTKAVQLLAKWCNLVSRISNRTEDEGDIAYKKVRKPLIDNITSVLSDMEAVSSDDAVETSEKAGLHVLIYTLKEILSCLTGEYDESVKKYFYVPFLLTDDVMLDEDYFPDLEMHSSTMNNLRPTVRILKHAANLRSGEHTYEKRLTEILDNKGDDYGAARLIVDYLMTKENTDELAEISSNIESGEEFAKDKADVRKDDFIGNLELAQSYGQIDNSVEDKKEKILQIVDEWYEWALESSNYGFFKRVMDGYLDEIREEAKSREADLLEQLESFKETTVSGLSAEAKEKRVARIQAMIKEQNYTVAEDLLARSSVFEEEQEELIDEDFLKEFLDHYDDYYHPVATRHASFATLVSSRTRNKEQRGAKRLADNWLPGGSRLGVDKLRNLLSCLGFKVANVKAQNAIGKFEHFSVQTEKAKGGQRDNYTHPIAAFGSGAALDGFRVVCINGAYDADSLIEIMKEIGNAKHTMILYDNAMPMSERRRLARKTKNALGDKLFAVVDRTVMMFLVRNYDETKMNKMLVSLITPFGYYQPYVWESANVMPPEIFMGRKQELERIKSPTGVNIVYGGRQLGKSALLKKAKEDIDWDENGNRAVLVDIKGLNYKRAAKKIGHELYDAFVLDDDIDTEDWDELARAVRRRLKSDNKRIPYLLLLLDEADVFIDSCAAVNYQPFDALKDIQSIGSGRFKFVIAGLRNIVRFKREALGNNSVLTHLQPMTVKPFNTSEARELMELPLHYLGLRFPKEKESLITLILATTNYFPGLIQMYCAKLINAMRNKDYANYNEVDTPIYEVSEEHIKKVLADPEFTQQIREKYVITLKLDEDNYYYLIALLMAYLYHSNGYNEGYSAADIKNAGIELEIEKIANLENAKLESFMEELKELNVLRNTDETHYLFTRFTFFQMMGTRAEVDDKLVEYMGA